MLIRLIPSERHGHILYALSFPTNLPDLPIPPAWSNQLHLLTSVLHIEPPHSIHVFDRSVGLVARVHYLTYDVPSKEVIVSFVDGRGVNIPMNEHCMQMLQTVVEDVQTCSEEEARGDNPEETSTSVCSSGASSQDMPSISTLPHKSPKLNRHKRQRSLLFSLISALVPRSLSPPPAPPPSPTTPTPPPLTPLPPIPPYNGSLHPIPQTPISSCNPASPSVTDPAILRCRARATLADVWRRHVVPALSAHNPYAGYTEWILRGVGTRVHSQVRDIERTLRRGAARGHAGTQNDRRSALDYGERSSEESQGRWRAPSPFPIEGESEHDDCVVYPRNQQDEWNIRHVRNPSSADELDAYAFEFCEENDSILRESFGFGADVYGDEWDDDHVFDNFGSSMEFEFDDGQLRFDGDLDFGEGKGYLTDTTFTPTLSNVTEGDDSDESQSSLRTPEDGEPPSLPFPTSSLGSVQNGTCFQQRNRSVSMAISKTTSSRPQTRPPQLSYRSPKSPQKSNFPPSPPPGPLKRNPILDMEEVLSARIELLSRIRSALTLARTRAHEERWGSVRSQNPFGCGLLDPESERLLETRARRRAWSAGIKISASSPPDLLPVAVPGSGPGVIVWDGSIPSVTHPLRGPPGLTSPVARMNEPIIPTGLWLGRPIRRSPLGMYVWSADDVVNQGATHNGKYGAISLKIGEETAVPKRPPRVSFLDSPTKLFPVLEERDDEPLEGNSSKIDFPQSPTSPTLPGNVASTSSMDERFCDSERDANMTEDESQEDPFFSSPFQMRPRTTSMYGCSQSVLSSQVLPMFRPRTPPPSYQAAVGEDESDAGTLDACALLCKPLSTLRLASPSPTRPPLVQNPPFAPRVRSRSLPTSQSDSLSPPLSPTSNDEGCRDLSRAYAAPPPPAIPFTVPPAISLTEPGLTYAHLHTPVPICGKGNVVKSIKGKEIASQEVIFERNGEEYTFGLEVSLGRGEEVHSVW